MCGSAPSIYAQIYFSEIPDMIVITVIGWNSSAGELCANIFMGNSYLRIFAQWWLTCGNLEVKGEGGSRYLIYLRSTKPRVCAGACA